MEKTIPSTPLEILLHRRSEAFSKYALLIKRAQEILMTDLEKVENGQDIDKLGKMSINVPDSVINFKKDH